METRGWADDRGETYHDADQGDSDDYRYFPEPDLPPLRVDAAWLARSAAALPELPAARRARYRDDLGPGAVRRRGARRRRRTRARLFEATLAAEPDARRRSRSRTGSPASTCGSGTPAPSRSRSIRRELRGDRPGGRRRVDLAGQRPRRSSRRTRPAGDRRPRSSPSSASRQISDTGRARRRSSTRSSRPTRPPSPTSAPASRRRSASSSARS